MLLKLQNIHFYGLLSIPFFYFSLCPGLYCSVSFNNFALFLLSYVSVCFLIIIALVLSPSTVASSWFPCWVYATPRSQLVVQFNFQLLRLFVVHITPVLIVIYGLQTVGVSSVTHTPEHWWSKSKSLKELNQWGGV